MRATTLAWLGAISITLLSIGCGPSYHQRVEAAIAELKDASTITVDANFGEGEAKGQLTNRATVELCELILAARQDPHPMSYVAPGKIVYRKPDGSGGELLLLQLGESEAGLRLSDGTYIRGISPESLKTLVEKRP